MTFQRLRFAAPHTLTVQRSTFGYERTPDTYEITAEMLTYAGIAAAIWQGYEGLGYAN